MIERKDEIAAAGTEVLLVAYDQLSLLNAKLLTYLAVPYQLLLDHSKQIYRDWGMGRTDIWHSMLSPTLTWRYIKLLFQGERFLGLAPDMYQLGGDFVVSPGGEIAFARRMAHNDDRAPVSVLLEELRKVSSPAKEMQAG
jgi:hypothetical protein